MPGGTVLVHLPTNRIFELNETGARIWELLTAGLDADAVAERLVDEFEVDRAVVMADLDSLLDRLSLEGLLSPAL
jgi:hypothetical protein